MPRTSRPSPYAVLLAACSLVFGAAARADEPPANASKPDKVRGTGGPTISAEARPILEAQLKRVREASSMTGKMTSEWMIKMEGESSATSQRTMTEEFALSKPSNLWVKSGDLTVFGDGKTLTVHHGKLKQYIQKPISGTMDIADEIGELSAGQIQNIAGEALINPSLTLEHAMRRFKSVTSVRTATEGGVAGRWVGGVLAADETGEGAEYKAEFFFPDGKEMRTRVWIDYTSYYANLDMGHAGDEEEDDKPAKVVSAGWLMTYSNVEFDKAIPAEKFVFTPGKDDKKVEEFSASRPRRSPQEELLGLAAPAFEGKDIDGNTIRLADLKGKVVLMDFWATWCGPCVQAMPKIQELKDKYEGKDVVFLGMNTDQPGSEKAVRKLLEKKKINIRQFDDSEGTASEAYRINGIPCIVLIDKASVVQAIHVGYGPGEDKKLAKELDTLLAGNSLKTEAEFKSAREAAAAGGDGEEDEDGGMAYSGAKKLELAGMSPERIAADGTVGRGLTPFFNFSSQSGTVVDLTGNGQKSLALQVSGSATLAVVKADGSGVDRVKLEGVSGRGVQISSVQVASLGGERRWVVSWMTMGMSGSKSGLGVFSMDGKKVWTFDPEAPKGTTVTTHASVGDVDGDNKAEVVVLVDAWKYGEGGGRDYSRGAALAVLDADGTVLTRHPLEREATFVHICPSASAGSPGAILVGSHAGVSRYRYDPRAKAVNAEKTDSAK